MSYSIEPIYNISGLGAASGLVLSGDSLFLIADNRAHLFEYDIKNKTLTAIPLIAGAPQILPKKEKPDVESIVAVDGSLFVFGSGSTPNRNSQFIYNLHDKNVRHYDWTAHYGLIKAQTGISDIDFNIEGVVYRKSHWLLFQRGNGLGAANGIIKYDEKTGNCDFIRIALPAINGIEATFTDAVLVDDKIHFVAAAENTLSTYHDGDILGSLYGVLDADNFTVEQTQLLSHIHKFEGIAFVERTANQLSFLLCEDNDSEQMESVIYKLTISL